MKAPSFALLLSGFVIWSGAFLLLYAIQATGCHLGWHQIQIGPISALRLLLVAILLMLLVVVGWLVWHTSKPRRDQGAEEIRILSEITRLLQIAALASTVIVYAGVAWLTLC